MVNGYKIKKVWQLFLLLPALIYADAGFAQTIEEQQWVDSIFATLDQEEKIGQLIMVQAYAGGNEDHYEALYEMIENIGIGGVVFMEGGPVAQIKLTNTLQEKTKIPLLIAMDAEWGPGMQLDSMISYPMAMALGALKDDSLIYHTALNVGNQLKTLGVHMNFAPVVDINSNPDNPVIGMRSFSDDPKIVTHKAQLYAAGLREAGILPVIKHFPGHGDTEIDMHLGLPVSKATRNVLINRELYPFREMAKKDIPAIMAGHLYAPNIINDGLPASLSPKIIREVIRDGWNYEGLIISDVLNNTTIAENFKKGQAEEFALKAGNDILLAPANINAAIRRIKRALKRDEITEQQLDASVKKILKTKYKAGLYETVVGDTANIISILNSAENRILKRKLSLNSITLAKNDQNIVPFHVLEDKHFAVVNIGDDGKVFNEFLSKYTYLNIYNEDGSPDLYEKLGLYDVVIVGIFSSRLQEEQVRRLQMLKSHTKVVLAIFGSPYLLSYFKDFPNLVWVPDQSLLSQQLLPQLLFGAEKFNGALPVSVEKLNRGEGLNTESLERLAFSIPEDVGIDSYRLQRIDEIVNESILDEATPGCQVLIARDGKVIFEKSYGHLTYDSIIPVTDFTLYDLASITKVAASVQMVMFLQERGLIDLDKKLSVYLKDLEGTNKENMTLRDILTHQAGLWPYLPFYRYAMTDDGYRPGLFSQEQREGYDYQVYNSLYISEVVRDSVWEWVKDSKLRDKNPREPFDYKYSDMGYYMILKLAEKLANQPLQEFLDQNLYDPLGLTSMGYLPLCNFPLTAIAPTEFDNYFRYGLVYGHVHDQGAALIGGVAGHAGLFSNALDLAKLMQMMLQKGSYGGRQYFKPETIELFTRQQYESNRRGIGWDKPVTDEPGGPTSNFVSPSTFGHTGFTGTAAWVDPEFNLVYVFLSNRVYPDATNTKLISSNVRTRIQDIVYQAMFREIQYEIITK